MKKLLLTALVAGAFVTSAYAADPVTPVTVSGGQVTFNGQITAGACSVAGDDVNKVVQLDTVPASTFTAADQAANAAKAFSISLKNCDTTTYKTVSVTFSGQTPEGKPALLANTAGAGAASNVALQLYGPDGAKLNLQSGSSTVNLVDNGETTIPLSVDYVSTGAKVGAGTVQSVAQFTLTYN